MQNIISKIKDRAHQGLLVRSVEMHVSKLLKALGIEIVLYYWVQERFDSDNRPYKKAPDDCVCTILEPEEMKNIGNIQERDEMNEAELLLRLKEGKYCFAIKYQGQLAAFTWFDLVGDSFTYSKIHLASNEAYLFDMYTLKQFRGNNYAAYLRYQSYKYLHEKGRTKYYSYSEVFNTPAVKFKKKLKAIFESLHLDVKLFNKFHWNWKIKDYPLDRPANSG
jgi:hypothetical protein